jgi:hypothetical protein
VLLAQDGPVGMTPALAAGLCTEMWEMCDLVEGDQPI